MKFCLPHWDALRAKIDERGLTSLVSEGGAAAAENLVSELDHGTTIDNFDPLMSAHFSIAGNAMEIAKSVGADPMAMLVGAPDHPEWECPVCFLNWLSDEHDRTCTEPACMKEKGMRFEWMLDRAADDALERWKELGS